MVPIPAFLIWSSTYEDETDLSPNKAPLLTRIGANTGNDMASKKWREKSLRISVSEVKALIIALSTGVNV